MKRQPEFLEKIIGLIEAAGIPYAVCGSLSSSLYGQSRATNDADIIISPTENQLAAFIKSLGKGYYLNAETAIEAMKIRSMFNVIDNELGWKADLIFQQDKPYQLSKFKRRKRAKLWGIDLWMLTPEDIILSKLEWAKDSGSEIQFRDVFGIVKLQWNKLDWDYIRHWAKILGVEKNLDTVIEEVKKLRGEK